MARRLRLEFPGACYHVINRGNYRRGLFAAKGAAECFERCLDQAARRHGWRVQAYVIMRNHFHLALETPQPNLSAGMKWLQGTWVVRFNRFRRQVGRPFQGRYKALHVEPGHALAQVAHYIHLNPARANIVSLENVDAYRWSSLWHFRNRNRWPWLDGAATLADSGGLADSPAGWERYVTYLGVIAEEDGRSRESRFGRLSRGWSIGSRAFQAELAGELTRAVATARFELLGANDQSLPQARAALWTHQLQVITQGFGVSLEQLPRPKSHPSKVRVAAAMKMLTPASNSWLAQQLSMGGAGSVSSLVSRFRRQKLDRSADFRDVLSRFAL